MNTLEIDNILHAAHLQAAEIAVREVKKHLAPFNLKRHQLYYDISLGLIAGDRRANDLPSSYKVCKALQDVDKFLYRLTIDVQTLVSRLL
jgi:hypothetical protein